MRGRDRHIGSICGQLHSRSYQLGHREGAVPAQISSPNIVIQASHNTKYAEAYVTGGITLKEIRRRSESDSLFDHADRSTVAIAYVINESDYEFSLKETVEACRRLGVPTLVDAAVVDPPIRGLKEVLKYDPDLISVSGGKGLNGPNSSGLLLGRSGPSQRPVPSPFRTTGQVGG